MAQRRAEAMSAAAGPKKKLHPVRLMVGGQPFVTSMEALNWVKRKVVGNSRVLQDVQEQAVKLGEKCTVHLDRDPHPWPEIVQYLNTGSIRSISHLSDLVKEARELGLEELSTMATQGNFIGWRPQSEVLVKKLGRRGSMEKGCDSMDSLAESLPHGSPMSGPGSPLGSLGSMGRLRSGGSSTSDLRRQSCEMASAPGSGGASPIASLARGSPGASPLSGISRRASSHVAAPPMRAPSKDNAAMAAAARASIMGRHSHSTSSVGSKTRLVI